MSEIKIGDIVVGILGEGEVVKIEHYTEEALIKYYHSNKLQWEWFFSIMPRDEFITACIDRQNEDDNE